MRDTPPAPPRMCPSPQNHLLQVLYRTAAAACNDRNRNCPGDRLYQFDVIALHFSIMADGIEQDFAGSQLLRIRSQIRRCSSDFFGSVCSIAAVSAENIRLRINGNDDTLAPGKTDRFPDHLRIPDERSIQDCLLITNGKKPADLFRRSDSSAVGKRHEGLGSNIGKQWKIRPWLFLRSADIEDWQFINAFVVEDPDGVDDIAEISRLFKMDRLDHWLMVNQKTWNDTRPEIHQLFSTKFLSSAIPYRWLFSGWNWTPYTFSLCTAAAKSYP